MNDMAITIDYSNPLQYVIQVPRADMALVQSTPVEIRQLDLDVFRLELNDIMDNVTDVWAPTNHEHTPPFTVSGVTLARVVEILDPYVIEFEDGLYNVNVTGGNSNVSDKTVKNQVGVNTANSAGLTYSKQVEDQSFADTRVWLDVKAGVAGTTFPIGTPGQPVNNLDDAIAIVKARTLPKRIHLRGSITTDASHNLDSYDILGSSEVLASLNVNSATSTDGLVVAHLTLAGDLNGTISADSAVSTTNLTDFDGIMHNSGLTGTINIADNATVVLDSCYSEVAGTSTPVIVMGLNCVVILRNYSGGIEIQGMHAGCVASIDLDPGRLTLGNTNVGGTVSVKGIGDLVDNSAGTAVDTDALVIGRVVDDIYKIHGLDESNPLTITDTQRAVGGITQTVSDNGTTTTVTRQS